LTLAVPIRMTVQATAFLVLFCVLSPGLASAQVQAPGEIQGFVTTQNRTVPLPGAEVTVKDGSDRQVAQVACAEDGHFRVPNLPPGRYRVSASLGGFDTARGDAVVAAGKVTDLSLDLAIEGVSANVEVVATPSGVSAEGAISKPETIGGKEMEQFAPTGGLQASLRLLASIIEVPGGVSIKGGRPSQAGVQLGPVTLVDPSTGLTQVSLPDDAIDSVAVLANPYAVEYGRFSSGLVVIQTRRAGDDWKVRINNIDPTFRTDRQNPVDVIGVGLWAPRIEVGGPLIKDRLFLEQTAQFRYNASDVPSLPENEVKISKAFSSFTRLDANLSPSQTLVATGGVFPSVVDWATLGTFTPYAATVDLHNNASQVALTERAVWTDTLFAETTVQMHDYQTDVAPQGTAPMILQPDTTFGNFYNQQNRHTSTYQLIESVSTSRNGPGGLHLFKVGFDLLDNQYDGTSVSQPVLIETTDGILARRLDFSGPTAQSFNSADAALFAQDRFQPNTRWSAEFGGRIDYDGVADRVNLTPRVGAVLRLDDAGSATLRGGFGLFFERTPSIAGAFDQFENVVDTRFASDGVTPLAPPVQFVRATSDLETARSQIWDIGYDHRLNNLWSLHIGGIDRRGSHELIVQALQTGATAGQLLLSSTGNSSYREADIGINFTYGTTADFHVSYTRSEALGDLNTLTNYMNAIMWPIVGANQYTTASTDVPNRLLARGRLMPTPRWLMLGIFDWHTGLPYSVVNDTLDFVGERDSLRFPTFVRLEVGLERRFKVLKFQPWIGVRVWNALSHFNPTDVQANLNSPYYGGFYNSEYRQFRLQVRFER
jgi:Carboxypeptidase regulatory-like domain/TonB dependent receptor